MTTLLSKRKMFVVALSMFSVTMSVVYGLTNHSSIPVESSHISASVLHEETPEESKEIFNESYYRKILDNQDDELVILNPNSTIKFSSENWFKNLELQEEDIIDSNFLSFIHPDDLPYLANQLMELSSTEEKISNIGPLRFMNEKGDYQSYMISLTPIKKKNGEIHEIAATLKDVSKPMGDVFEEKEKLKKEENKLKENNGNDIKLNNETYTKQSSPVTSGQSPPLVDTDEEGSHPNNGHGNNEDHIDEGNPSINKETQKVTQIDDKGTSAKSHETEKNSKNN